MLPPHLQGLTEHEFPRLFFSFPQALCSNETLLRRPVTSPSEAAVPFSRTFSSGMKTNSEKLATAPSTIKDEPANAYPETPLHFYRATPYSEGSINHRFFYINLVFLLFVYDVGSALIDL